MTAAGAPLAAPAAGGNAVADHPAVALLRKLIAFDTVNPPGNERAAQEHLAELLRGAGFEVELTGAEPERPNLVARLPAASPGPVVGLLSHVDTVPADAADWTHGPWSGTLAGGCVWGRGALDMKSQTAAEVAAAVELAAAGWRPARGELRVIVLVDEETGSALGAEWLCTERPDLARCDLYLNEGGGAPLGGLGPTRYGVCVGEKAVLRVEVSTEGRAAHASTPDAGDNALLKLAPVLGRLARRRAPIDLTPATAALLRALGHPPGDDPDRALAALRTEEPQLAELLDPMLRVTAVPTIVSASETPNTIPARARLLLDCRIPAGLGETDALARVRALVGAGEHRLTVVKRIPGNASPLASPLMDALQRWRERTDPGAQLVPVVLPGFTDSRVFRAAFPGSVAYGFFPHRHMTVAETSRLVHAADERIDVRDVVYASACFREVVLDLLGDVRAVTPEPG